MKLGELIKLIKETHPDDYEEVRLDFYLMPKNEGMDEDERDDVILKEPVRISYDTDYNAYVELGFKVQESRKENIYGGGILPYKYYFEDINQRDEEKTKLTQYSPLVNGLRSGTLFMLNQTWTIFFMLNL